MYKPVDQDDAHNHYGDGDGDDAGGDCIDGGHHDNDGHQ